MNRHIFITLLVVWGALCIGANAQTPYDAFAPETSRPMLGLDAINMMENPSQCNVINDSIRSTKSSADDISKWLSVDSLADKYPNISPYAYCGWNPVKFVDPDGRIVYFAPGVSQSFKDDFKKAVKYMNQYKIGGMLYKLHQSKKIYYIAEGNVDGNSEFRPDNNNTITWSSRFAIITEDNLYEMSPVEVLNHEIDHALKYDTDPVQQKKDFDSKDPDYGNLEEKRVIMGSEQETARKLGKLKPGEVTRNNHNGTAYETTSPTSTEPKWSCTPQEN